MKNQMTIQEFQQYVIKEAKKLYQIEILKEEKNRIERDINFLQESAFNIDGADLSDPEILKQVRQAMLQKAAGWATPEPKQQLNEKKYSDAAQDFIGKEISHLEKDKGYKHDRAVAAAINVAKDKGYKVPEKKNEETETLYTGPEWYMYFFKIKHDKGVAKFKVPNTSEEDAKKVLAKVEGAPESAIEFVKAVPMNIK